MTGMGKKFLPLAISAILALSFNQNALAQGKNKVGIILSSDQVHYKTALDGVLAQFKKRGFTEDKIDYDIRIGEVKKEKIIEIARELKEKAVDLIITIGTPATIATCSEIKDIPIIFSRVFDPVNTGIIKSWESSGNNVTGCSSWVNMDSVVRILRKLGPAKQIGVIYTDEETAAVLQLNELKKIQEKMGFIVVPAKLSKSEDAQAVANTLVGKVDSIFITGGTIVWKGLEVILGVAKSAKIITVSHIEERSEKGVLLTIAANSYATGEIAGEKAIQVLKGIKPAYIPIERLEQYEITINLKTAKEIGLEIPGSFLKTASKIIE